ncbi:hypothetical protein ACOME3_009080 [Neoechinorhynchus agilis]
MLPLAFKLLQLALLKFGPDILYGDTSLFYYCKVDWDAIVNDNRNSEEHFLMGIAARELPGHYVNCFTDTGTFDWFGDEALAFNTSYVAEAGFLMASDITLTRIILLAWITCALDPQCISPNTYNVNCMQERFGYSHRYDQSALSIILTYFFFPSKLLENTFEPSAFDMYTSVQYPVARVDRSG